MTVPPSFSEPQVVADPSLLRRALRVSVSDLDSFRQFRDDEDGDLNALLRQIRRLEPPSEPMLAGSALHKALEVLPPDAPEVLSLASDGYVFSIECDIAMDLPRTRELKAESVLDVQGTIVTLVGKVDAIEGTRVDDHKTTGYFDAERFHAGYAWRCYLMMFGANRFRWNVFEMKPHGPEKVYAVTGFHQMEQFRYPGMEADVLRLLTAYVRFAEQHLSDMFQEVLLCR